MTPTPEVQARLRQYLLGQLDDDHREEVEKDLLAKDEVFEELLVVEDEVTDEYINGRLNELDRRAFETYFLATPERREKLRFGSAFNRYLSSQEMVEAELQPATWPQPKAASRWHFPGALFSSPVRIAVFALLAIAVALGLWRIFFHQSEVDKGLMALNAAYKEQRPVESRISALSYAQFPQTRGPNDSPRVNVQARDRAELILNSAAEDPHNAAAHHALGQVYLAAKRFDEAITQFDLALKSDPKNTKLYSDLGAAWLEKGKADMTGKEGEGMEELGRAQENLSKALELDPNLLEARFNRALCEEGLKLFWQSELDWQEYLKRDTTSAWADEARERLTRLRRKSGSARTKEQLYEDFLNAYHSKADDAAWQAFRLSRTRAGNTITEALLDEYLRRVVDSPAKASEQELQVLAYAAELERRRVADRFTSDLVTFYQRFGSSQQKKLVEARDLMRAGNSEYNISEFDHAVEHYSRAKALFVAAGDDCESIFAENLIGYCSLRNLDPDVIAYFETLAARFNQRRYLSLASQSFQALADAQSSVNQISKTLEYANRGLRQAQQIEDDATAVRCLTRLLITKLDLGDYDESLKEFLSSTELAEGVPPDPKLTWPNYYQAGLSFHFLGLSRAALAFEREALRLAENAGVPLLRARTYERLGVFYGEQKQFAQAIIYGERALAESEKIDSGRARTNMMAHSFLRLGRLKSDVGQYSEAVGYFDKSLISYQKLNSALYLYEARKGKLVAHIRLGDDTSAQAELPQVIELFEQNRKSITDEMSRDKFFDTGQDVYDLAIDFTYKKGSVEEALAYAEKSRARSLYQMMRTGARVIEDGGGELRIKLDSDSEPLSTAQIQTALPKKTQVLEFSVLSDKVIFWVVTGSSIKSEYRFITEEELEKKLQAFVDVVTHRRSISPEVTKQLSMDLYATLITPVEKHLDRNLQLTIIPDKGLNYLPFNALLSPTSGHFLIEDYVVQRAPSSTVFIASSQRASQLEHVANERLLSVGNPKFNAVVFGSLPDLPAAAKEAEQVASFYRPETHLVGAAATTKRVKQNWADADVLHLATHAVADERSPLLSKLLLAEDTRPNTQDPENGVLQAAAIYGTSLPRTRLVVLSACRTGIEQAYRGEGAIGLARPFMVAGVPIVIASLWPVESNATADLMISFHRHRKEDSDHISSVEALRRAQLEMIQLNRSNPNAGFDWAGFVAIGGYATF
jgi:CHAT domain-containing protein/tetratricopeptide (TPR) repeat protein